MNVPKLRFKEFSGEWEIKKLGEVFNITSGTTPLRANVKFFENGTHLWVKTTDLNNGLIIETGENVTDLALQETSLKILPKDTVLVAMYGGFNQIGRTGLLTRPASVNQALSAILPNYNVVIPYYLLTFLNHKVDEWKILAASSRKDPNISKKDVESFLFVFPKISEQTKIANFLRAVDEKIEQLVQKVSLLQRYKKGVMQQIFSQQLRFKDENGQDFPEWEEKTLEQLASVERGKFSVRPRNDPRYFGGTIPFVQTGDVVAAGLFLKKFSQTLNDAGLKVSRLFPKNTVLITIAANIGDTTVTQFDVACTDSVVAIQPYDKKANPVWLKLVLDTKKADLDANSSKNAQKNINLQVLKPLVLNTPCFEEQTKIANFLSAIDDKITNAQQQLDATKQYKKSLLQQMFV